MSVKAGGGGGGAAEQGDGPQIESRPRKARTPTGASITRSPKKKGLLPPEELQPRDLSGPLWGLGPCSQACPSLHTQALPGNGGVPLAPSLGLQHPRFSRAPRVTVT